MRQNQNPILRCAVAEGKSEAWSPEHRVSRTERQKKGSQKETKGRPHGRPARRNSEDKTKPCRKAYQRYRLRSAREIARPGTP
jgi:hypothetical protein